MPAPKVTVPTWPAPSVVAKNPALQRLTDMTTKGLMDIEDVRDYFAELDRVAASGSANEVELKSLKWTSHRTLEWSRICVKMGICRPRAYAGK